MWSSSEHYICIQSSLQGWNSHIKHSHLILSKKTPESIFPLYSWSHKKLKRVVFFLCFLFIICPFFSTFPNIWYSVCILLFCCLFGFSRLQLNQTFCNIRNLSPLFSWAHEKESILSIIRLVHSGCKRLTVKRLWILWTEYRNSKTRKLASSSIQYASTQPLFFF